MGVGPDTTAVATWILSQDKIPVVLDADGINCIAQNIHLLSASKASVVLTPHPGEMARLLGCTAREVQQNRVEIASTFAREYGVTLVLKGAGTLVASADGNVYINRTGNHGMAKGGSGDLLAGMIASLIAQGLDPALAAATAVYFHGLAGDLAAKRWSARAMQPGQMLETLAEAFCPARARGSGLNLFLSMLRQVTRKGTVSYETQMGYGFFGRVFGVGIHRLPAAAQNLGPQWRDAL